MGFQVSVAAAVAEANHNADESGLSDSAARDPGVNAWAKEKARDSGPRRERLG